VDSLETAFGELAVPRIQVRIRGFWREVAREEASRIGEHLARGEAHFMLVARDRVYDMDFSEVGRAIQRNTATGTTRRLRLLIADGEQQTWDSLVTTQPPKKEQENFGRQSQRGSATQVALRHLKADHAINCFARLARNEHRHVAEWAVFYHSYSHAALIYEVQAALANVLFGFRSDNSPLPRLLMHEFFSTPDAPSLIKRFNECWANNKRDHHWEYRKVALSTMCSLSARGPETCPAKVFQDGYSCKDVSFLDVLERLLETCRFRAEEAKGLAQEIVALAAKYCMDNSQFGGDGCENHQPGHILQIFVRRPLVDKLAYAAKPYGFVDQERMPISEWMNGDNAFTYGQARVVAHPEHFMQASHVRMYVASADPNFDTKRKLFQRDLCNLLQVLQDPRRKEDAVTGIYGGVVPAWWRTAGRKSSADR